MTECVVFTGPTLPSAEVAALLPAARVLPPVRHGDLLRLDVGAGDQVLIIDGLFLQTASVRHREILSLLQRGVTVAGSSSMGALRAAELRVFGMRGFGEVYRLYRDGEIDGDDEVAIVHGTAEDGHRGYSDPLVAIRIALRDAAAEEAISERDARQLLSLAIATPFRSRSFRSLELAARGQVPAGAIEAFRSWRSGHDTDAKAADARVMLRAAAAADPELRPAGPGDQPVRHVHTRMFDMWELRSRGVATEHGWVSDADAATVIRLAHPAFRDAHRRHVLSRVAGVDPDHPALAERAVAVAQARGLLAPTRPRPGLPPLPGAEAEGTGSGWLTERDLARPADEALVTLLVRAFGVQHPGLASRWDLPPELRTPATLARGRDFIAAARQSAERGPGSSGPDGEPSESSGPAATDLAVARLWGCPPADLQAQAWDRGIADLAELRRLAGPYTAHLAGGARLAEAAEAAG